MNGEKDFLDVLDKSYVSNVYYPDKYLTETDLNKDRAILHNNYKTLTKFLLGGGAVVLTEKGIPNNSIEGGVLSLLNMQVSIEGQIVTIDNVKVTGDNYTLYLQAVQKTLNKDSIVYRHGKVPVSDKNTDINLNVEELPNDILLDVPAYDQIETSGRIQQQYTLSKNPTPVDGWEVYPLLEVVDGVVLFLAKTFMMGSGNGNNYNVIEDLQATNHLIQGDLAMVYKYGDLNRAAYFEIVDDMPSGGIYYELDNLKYAVLISDTNELVSKDELPLLPDDIMRTGNYDGTGEDLKNEIDNKLDKNDLPTLPSDVMRTGGYSGTGQDLKNEFNTHSSTNNPHNITKATIGLDLVDNTADLNKNVLSATKLATARSINGSNFDGSENITTANWGSARNMTIGNSTKSVNGSENVAWSATELGLDVKLDKGNYEGTGQDLKNEIDSLEEKISGSTDDLVTQDNAIWGGLYGGYIQDESEKIVGQRYIDQIDGKAYICKVPSQINSIENYTPCNVVDNTDKLDGLQLNGWKIHVEWMVD